MVELGRPPPRRYGLDREQLASAVSIQDTADGSKEGRSLCAKAGSISKIVRTRPPSYVDFGFDVRDDLSLTLLCTFPYKSVTIVIKTKKNRTENKLGKQ